MRIVFPVLIIALFLVSIVAALPTFQVYDNNIDSYGGQIARDRRIFDPYTRDRYFGADYYRPYQNFGQKGPTNMLLNTGAKSAYSSVFNLDTNSMTNEGRNPGKISNWDPKVRGYPRLDKSVSLLPYDPVEQSFAQTPVLAQGTARLLSIGDVYGSGMDKPFPQTQIQIVLQNLPPADDNEIYEAWLLDDQSGYALNLGIMKSAAKTTAELLFTIPRQVYMFEHVIITKEPFPDEDPRPGEIILAGNIDPARSQLTINPSYFERLR